MADLIGQRLGQYEILGVLGEGGMATVYRAMRRAPRSEVAVKVIKTRAFNPDVLGEFVRRFEREAETIASLSHPHILKLFDYGQEEDTVYLVMEFLRGGSLAGLIRKGTLTPEQCSAILDQVATALDYAHLRGIVHRDLKPQNVLLDEQGNAILTDFGIAKIASVHTELTHKGSSLGTPEYMAPEQWRGDPMDGRTDNYALGIIAFEMLTGQTPFTANTPAAIMYLHMQEPPPRIAEYRKDIPPALENVIAQALEKEPEKRYSTATEFARAFKQALITPAESPKRSINQVPLVLGAGLAALVLLIVAVLAFSNRQAAPTPTTMQAAMDSSPTATLLPTDSPGAPMPKQILQSPTPSPTSTATPTFTPTASFTATMNAQGTGRAAAISSATRQSQMTGTVLAKTAAFETLQADVLGKLTIAALTFTRTPTPTPTRTHTYTNTPSFTATFTNTPTATATHTATPSYTATASYTPSSTPTTTSTPTPTVPAGPAVMDVLVAALTPVPTVTSSGGKAWVRLLHAAPNVQAAKLLVNGSQVGQTITFGLTFDNGEFIVIPAGSTAITIADKNDQPLINGEKTLNFTLNPNSITTFILFGFNGDTGVRKLQLIPLYHNTALKQLGDKASVQFLNALVYDVTKSDSDKERFPMDFWSADLFGDRNPTEKIQEKLHYGEITPPLNIDPAFQSYTVTLPGETKNYISQPLRLQLERQRAYTMVLIGYTSNDFQPRRVVQLVAISLKVNSDGSPYVATPTPVPTTTRIPPTAVPAGSGGNNGGGGGSQPTNPPQATGPIKTSTPAKTSTPIKTTVPIKTPTPCKNNTGCP